MLEANDTTAPPRRRLVAAGAGLAAGGVLVGAVLAGTLSAGAATTSGTTTATTGYAAATGPGVQENDGIPESQSSTAVLSTSVAP